MRKEMIVLACMMIFLVYPAIAQEADLEDHPGFVNLEEIEIPESAEEIVDITIGPAFIRFAQSLSGDEHENRHFSGIISVRVKAFESFHSDMEKLKPIVQKIETLLDEKEWESLVRVRGEDNYVNVHLKFIEEKVVGLMVMAMDTDDDEVAFINITGEDIKMSNIGHLDLGINGCRLLGNIFSDSDWH